MDTPLNMLIVGPTSCGKTTYLLDMIESDYYRHFTNIVLLCPTFPYNTTYTSWRYVDDPKLYAISIHQDRVDETLGFVMDHFRGTNTLLILDDCAAGQDVKNRTSHLVEAAFSARHFGLSVFVLTQQLTSIAKPFRENVSRLIAFFNPSKWDMKAITDDYLLGVSDDKVKVIVEKLRAHKYAHLDINLRHPYDYSVVVP